MARASKNPLSRMTRVAKTMMANPAKVGTLVASAKRWLVDRGTSIGELRDDVMTMVRLVSAWRKGEYEGVSGATICWWICSPTPTLR